MIRIAAAFEFLQQALVQFPGGIAVVGLQRLYQLFVQVRRLCGLAFPVVLPLGVAEVTPNTYRQGRDCGRDVLAQPSLYACGLLLIGEEIIHGRELYDPRGPAAHPAACRWLRFPVSLPGAGP